jgi:hypothetical protein
MGAEVLGNRLKNLVIAQIHVTAAFFAHCRFRRGGHLQFRAALKTGNELLLDDGLLRLGSGLNRLLNAEMLTAFFANSRVSASRFRL